MVRLEFVENLNNAFDQLQAILEEMDSSFLENNTRFDFVSIYLEVKAKLTCQLNYLKDPVSQPRSSTVRQFSFDETQSNSFSHRRSRLPELKIP